MDEFVLWQEFIYVFYGPIILASAGVAIAGGLLAVITISMAETMLGATRF